MGLRDRAGGHGGPHLGQNEACPPTQVHSHQTSAVRALQAQLDNYPTGPASRFINTKRALEAREGQTIKVSGPVRHCSSCSSCSSLVRPKARVNPRLWLRPTDLPQILPVGLPSPCRGFGFATIGSKVCSHTEHGEAELGFCSWSGWMIGSLCSEGKTEMHRDPRVT